jgi:hypothetical protein
VLDNEANKLMLEADSLQASEEKYKLSYYEIEKNLKLLLLVTVLLMMTTSGVYSQKQLTSSPTTRTITSVQRDSIFVKIQRGKIDAEKLLFLRSLYQSAVQLKLCMSKLYS